MQLYMRTLIYEQRKGGSPRRDTRRRKCTELRVGTLVQQEGKKGPSWKHVLACFPGEPVLIHHFVLEIIIYTYFLIFWSPSSPTPLLNALYSLRSPSSCLPARDPFPQLSSLLPWFLVFYNRDRGHYCSSVLPALSWRPLRGSWWLLEMVRVGRHVSWSCLPATNSQRYRGRERGGEWEWEWKWERSSIIEHIWAHLRMAETFETP